MVAWRSQGEMHGIHRTQGLHHLDRFAARRQVLRLPHFSYFTVRFAVVACVKVAEVPVNVIVNVPWEATFGTFKSTVTLAI